MAPKPATFSKALKLLRKDISEMQKALARIHKNALKLSGRGPKRGNSRSDK